MRDPKDEPELPSEIRQRLLALLSRREHSAEELVRKLRAKGFHAGQVAEAVGALIRQGVCSDDRFTESFTRACVGRGQGPVKIRAALRERGVDERLIDTHLGEDEEVWMERSRAARAKRFGPVLPSEPRELARQSRFLSSRGFTQGQIRSALKAQQDVDRPVRKQD